MTTSWRNALTQVPDLQHFVEPPPKPTESVVFGNQHEQENVMRRRFDP